MDNKELLKIAKDTYYPKRSFEYTIKKSSLSPENITTLLNYINKNKIVYTITSAGKLFSEVIDTIKILQSRGIEIYIASGDRKGAINKLAEILNVNKKHAFGTVSPKGRCKVVRCLKDRGYKVMMVGDGLNDVLAFNNADVSVLTVEQEEEVSPKLINKTDYVIQKISEVISIDF